MPGTPLGIPGMLRPTTFSGRSFRTRLIGKVGEAKRELAEIAKEHAEAVDFGLVNETHHVDGVLGLQLQLVELLGVDQNVMALGMLIAFDDLLICHLGKRVSVPHPHTYLMGLPDGSLICRKLIASAVETAGTSLTGIKTRDSRRLPDHKEGGAMNANSNATRSANLVVPQSCLS